jgi:hypothetical protein
MVEFTQTLVDISSGFSYGEAILLLKPLLLFIVGMGIYAWFIFKFYRFVAKREIFRYGILGSGKSEKGVFKKILHGIGYGLKYLILFPLLTFFWVIILSMILAFLSKTGNMENVLLVTMALVGVIRIMAYYNEDLSKDLSKMLPFALLGVFLVDISYFSISDSLTAIYQLPTLWKTGVYYLLFIVLLEFVLRIATIIFGKGKSE